MNSSSLCLIRMVKPRAQEAREGEAAAKPKKSTGKKAGKREAVEEAEEGDQDAKGASMGKVLECAVEKAGGEAWAEEGEEEGMEAQDECVEDEAEDCMAPWLWLDVPKFCGLTRRTARSRCGSMHGKVQMSSGPNCFYTA